MARPIVAPLKPRFSARVTPQLNVGGYTLSHVIRLAPTLAIWGAGASVAGALYLSQIPLFQKDVLLKIPGVAEYYKDNTPDSDKPF